MKTTFKLVAALLIVLGGAFKSKAQFTCNNPFDMINNTNCSVKVVVDIYRCSGGGAVCNQLVTTLAPTSTTSLSSALYCAGCFPCMDVVVTLIDMNGTPISNCRVNSLTGVLSAGFTPPGVCTSSGSMVLSTTDVTIN